MILYRGDSKDSNMFSELEFDAIFSHLVNKGDPEYVYREGFLTALRKHIKGGGDDFQSVSHFISFSDKKQNAKYFACKHFDINAVYCASTDADFCLITIDLNLDNLIAKGIYKVNYYCNYNEITKEQLDKLDYKPSCGFCCKSTKLHTLYVFNPLEILNKTENKKEYDLARKHNEWLLLPSDYIDELNGNSARIYRSNIWKVEYFKSRNKCMISCEDCI